MANNTRTDSRKATPNTVKQDADKKPTFTKAGPNSRSGGKNRGSNNPSNVNFSVLAQRHKDIILEQERRTKEREDRELEFRGRQAFLALEMIDAMKFDTITRTSVVDGKTVEIEIKKKVSPDMRLGARAMLANFPTAAKVVENKQVIKGREQSAIDQASLEIAPNIVVTPNRMRQVQDGFRLAKKMLKRAYDMAKAEQAS